MSRTGVTERGAAVVGKTYQYVQMYVAVCFVVCRPRLCVVPAVLTASHFTVASSLHLFS
jgi:hypothetical protein